MNLKMTSLMQLTLRMLLSMEKWGMTLLMRPKKIWLLYLFKTNVDVELMLGWGLSYYGEGPLPTWKTRLVPIVYNLLSYMATNCRLVDYLYLCSFLFFFLFAKVWGLIVWPREYNILGQIPCWYKLKLGHVLNYFIIATEQERGVVKYKSISFLAEGLKARLGSPIGSRPSWWSSTNRQNPPNPTNKK